MLTIYFGEMKDAVYNTAIYFDNTYHDEWIMDPLSMKMIKSIDKAEVIGPHAINSKALGVIPVKQLSGGVKTLLLMQHNRKKVFNASTCGDNCAKWILKLAKISKEDLTINLYHLMDFGEKDFEIRIANTGEIVHNMKEYIVAASPLI